jgi:hypothetical protein
MITDNLNCRLNEIQAFAKEKNLLESFKETFSRFETYTDKGCTVTLYSNFAPLSLYFEITMNEIFILNWGFIFHGPMMALEMIARPHSQFALTLIINQAGLIKLKFMVMVYLPIGSNGFAQVGRPDFLEKSRDFRL